MKRIYTISSLALAIALTFSSCSNSDDSASGLPSVTPCDLIDNDLMVLKTAFDNNPNAIITYNAFAVNGLDGTLPNALGNLTTTTNLSYELPTGATFYDSQNAIHGIYVTRAGKYFKYDAMSGLGQEFSVSTEATAPVQLGGNTYVIEIPAGFTTSGIGNHFSIKPFNINNGSMGAALSIPSVETTFDNNSFFGAEAMSATSNGTDKLYYLSGTNLITVNPFTLSASHVDLFPSFSMTNFMRFIGLEYDDTLGLLAILIDYVNDVTLLVKVDPLTGTYSSLMSLPNTINSEFYATAYSSCENTYYLTTLSNNFTTTETLYFEFDLDTNTIINSQILPEYNYGIELIPTQNP